MKKILNVLALAGIAMLCLPTTTQSASLDDNPLVRTMRERQEKATIDLLSTKVIPIGNNEIIPPVGTFFPIDDQQYVPMPFLPKTGVVIGKDALDRYYYVDLEDPSSKLKSSDTQSQQSMSLFVGYEGDDPTFGTYFQGISCPSNGAPCLHYLMRSNQLSHPSGWKWTDKILVQEADIIIGIWPQSCHAHTNDVWTNGIFVTYGTNLLGTYSNSLSTTMSTSTTPVIANGDYLLYSIHGFVLTNTSWYTNLSEDELQALAPMSLIIETNAIPPSTNGIDWDFLTNSPPYFPPDIFTPPPPWWWGIPGEPSVNYSMSGIPGSTYEVEFAETLDSSGDFSSPSVVSTVTLDGSGHTNAPLDFPGTNAPPQTGLFRIRLVP